MWRADSSPENPGAVGAARRLCHRLQPLLPAGRPGITILAYHLVGAGTGSPVDLPPGAFRLQMEELRRAGRVISLTKALRHLEGSEVLDGDRVVVTFDDAYDNFDRMARPVLERLEIPATLFVPTDFVDGACEGPLAGAEDLPPMRWERLRDLAREGLVELGSHSRSHPDLRALGRADLEREIRGSRDMLRDRTGVNPRIFCYPRGLWSRRVERIVAQEYRCAVVGGGRKNRPGRARLDRLQRISMRRDMPASIEPLIGAGLVLEEWIANQVRLSRRAYSRRSRSGPHRTAGVMSSPHKELHLAVVVTHPLTARLLLAGQLRYFSEQGFQVTLVTSPGPYLDGVAEREGVEVRTVPMSREINPLRDVLACLRLARLFRRLRPDVVNAGTPKAGLLGMLAARAVGVPVRIYTLRGLRLETASGFKRWALVRIEWLTASAAHRVLCVSESVRRRAVELGLMDEEKTEVPGLGSSNGVDVERFAAAAADSERLRELRTELGLPEGVPVIGFVGRFTRDKGIAELIEALDRVSQELPEVRLLLLGDFESGDPVAPELVRRLREDARVMLPGFVPDTAPFYPLMDVLALPSYREGFPNAPLEAAAAGVPTVGSLATGVVEAVVDGYTGTLVPVADAGALTRALLTYLRDPGLRRRHGVAARERVRKEFRREVVWEAWERAIRRVADGATGGAVLGCDDADRD